MNRKSHLENIYSTKAVTDVSWFRKHLDPSLELIESAKLEKDAAIIDVGGGASTLVDDLLDRGFSNITALDIFTKSSRQKRTTPRLSRRGVT